jgi:hypothetical protein
MRGGASLYQPLAYFKGGFYPSLMGGVLSNGPILITPALASGFRLMRNNAERMSKRRRSLRRGTRRRTSKRTLNKGKNTRKA